MTHIRLITCWIRVCVYIVLLQVKGLHAGPPLISVMWRSSGWTLCRLYVHSVWTQRSVFLIYLHCLRYELITELTPHLLRKSCLLIMFKQEVSVEI